MNLREMVEKFKERIENDPRIQEFKERLAAAESKEDVIASLKDNMKE